MASLARGHRLGNRYRIEEALARGGMGAVYRAVDERLGSEVAIKVMLRELGQGTTEVARFEREALAASSLRHPGIVQVLDVGKEPDGTSYMVMELVRGETLAAVLMRDGKLAPARAADIVEQALFALSVAHGAGVVHRDLKPGNLMLVSSGGRETVKLLDFGVAQLKLGASHARLTKEGVLVGTPAFMAPEQARGEPSDARSDVYAMGVLLWALCTGRAPFMAKEVADILVSVLNDKAPRADAVEESVPAALASICEMAMQKRPEDRFASASAFASALMDLRTRATSAPAAARPPGGVAGTPPRSETGRPATNPFLLVALGLAFVTIIGLCVVVAGLAVLFALGDDPLSPAAPRSVCVRAADCCLVIAGADRAAATSCESIRSLDAYGGAGCADALVSYRGSVVGMGRDPSMCD